ncbi:DUF1294 domain-containing protein [Cellulosilyticum ruminicola]|uniref:DUF1294 domain-containing protein n=1 Tax=Cellulosilyticum ruminicola TaxID=425254 RepID=UPI0006D1B9BC|nr:DUF1294 domain-containing protein [Cellulosilyticum ruminicola]
MGKIILIYIVIINLMGFLSMWLDKKKAIKHQYRIPEKTLFILAILGGSIGSILGMNKFRHKTKHWYFKYGIPFILIVQIIFIYFVYKYLGSMNLLEEFLGTGL